MFDEITIGARLKTLRRWRGMTLEEVSGLSGLSKGFLSYVENGKRALDRRSHIAALASALRVSEADIVGGPHLTKDPVQSEPHGAVPAIRRALATNTLTEPGVDRARPLPELVAEVERVEPFHQACDYAKLGEALPALLDELHRHVAEPADEAAFRVALEALVQACTAATFTAKDLGYPDLAHLAAMRAMEAATILEDPAKLGEASFCRIHTMPRAGSWDRTLAAAEKAAEALEPAARDPHSRQVLGMLSLSAALAAAVQHDSDTAAGWLGEARALADRVDDAPDENWMSFSATNVGVWDVAVGVECGLHGGAVLELAKQVDEDKLTGKPGRHAAFLADVGRGLARDRGNRAEAVRWLQRAEKAAPQWIRNNKSVRDAVAVLLSRARAEAGGRELRGMAARMGIPH
ncbi:helix-turn-helix transcriptional regulator [Actinomadura fulvescens]|uniref:Helix-turn-helix transcriptional regulator n=1 Tax=Actinomadura fulvescens TaxID=46160 RepID=A0ABP6D4B8_9ACTN